MSVWGELSGDAGRNQMLLCPVGRKCRLHVINEEEMFVECFPTEPEPCKHAIEFGGGTYCRLLWKYDKPR